MTTVTAQYCNQAQAQSLDDGIRPRTGQPDDIELASTACSLTPAAQR